MAHECPICGQTCFCSGDIDDIIFGVNHMCKHCEDDDDDWEDYIDEDYVDDTDDPNHPLNPPRNSNICQD